MSLIDSLRISDEKKAAPAAVCVQCVAEGLQIDIRNGPNPFYEALCWYHLMVEKFRNSHPSKKSS